MQARSECDPMPTAPQPSNTDFSARPRQPCALALSAVRAHARPRSRTAAAERPVAARVPSRHTWADPRFAGATPHTVPLPPIATRTPSAPHGVPSSLLACWTRPIGVIRLGTPLRSLLKKRCAHTNGITHQSIVKTSCGSSKLVTQNPGLATPRWPVQTLELERPASRDRLARHILWKRILQTWLSHYPHSHIPFDLWPPG